MNARELAASLRVDFLRARRGVTFVTSLARCAMAHANEGSRRVSRSARTIVDGSEG